MSSYAEYLCHFQTAWWLAAVRPSAMLLGDVIRFITHCIPVRELALFVVYLKSGGSGKCAVALSQLLR